MSPIERARGAIGARFLLHGRCVAHGLDCVGLAGLAYGIAVPRGYALRGGRVAQVIAAAEAAGLVRVDDARVGDLLLLNAGAGQLHLAIASETGVIHADAALRRVVERPGVPPWPELARWRLKED
ncbi:peptidoglycan endopeptidase [Sphingomonas sp. R647]|uniref:peptidoglycan endopeptidase n=1 Tax=Sphingomonas sp. R647 TaxID=2875233 RepID=UPI001CD326FD|nr:peptidoglycan endopeptidase [Sphingomonas sp. R647]MCA1198732.1 peptidoglycan endopeptidase [Sphingomonas sp. R647]